MGKQLHATACFEIQLDDFFCCPIERQFFSLLLQIEACFLRGSSSRGNVSSGVAVPFIARSIRFVVVVGRARDYCWAWGCEDTHDRTTVSRRILASPRLNSSRCSSQCPKSRGQKILIVLSSSFLSSSSPVSPFSDDRGAAGE